MEPLRGLTPDMGVSINEADIWEPNAGRAFWGEGNLQRLEGIKKIDPGNLMTNWGAVGWDEGDERYKCYPKL